MKAFKNILVTLTHDQRVTNVHVVPHKHDKSLELLHNTSNISHMHT